MGDRVLLETGACDSRVDLREQISCFIFVHPKLVCKPSTVDSSHQRCTLMAYYLFSLKKKCASVLSSGDHPDHNRPPCLMPYKSTLQIFINDVSCKLSFSYFLPFNACSGLSTACGESKIHHLLLHADLELQI